MMYAASDPRRALSRMWGHTMAGDGRRQVVSSVASCQ